MITADTKIYYCEHYQKELPEVTYMNLYAGETVRFIVCRLCANVFLGTIVRAAIEFGAFNAAKETDER